MIVILWLQSHYVKVHQIATLQLGSRRQLLVLNMQ